MIGSRRSQEHRGKKAFAWHIKKTIAVLGTFPLVWSWCFMTFYGILTAFVFANGNASFFLIIAVVLVSWQLGVLLLHLAATFSGGHGQFSDLLKYASACHVFPLLSLIVTVLAGRNQLLMSIGYLAFLVMLHRGIRYLYRLDRYKAAMSIGLLLLLADIDGEVAFAAVQADDHPLVHFGAGLNERVTTLLGVVEPVGNLGSLFGRDEYTVAHALDRNDLRGALANQRDDVGMDARRDLRARTAHHLGIPVTAIARGALARQRHRHRDRGIEQWRAGRPGKQRRVRHAATLDRSTELRDSALLAV